jgi:hypothetical protein
MLLQILPGIWYGAVAGIFDTIIISTFLQLAIAIAWLINCNCQPHVQFDVFIVVVLICKIFATKWNKLMPIKGRNTICTFCKRCGRMEMKRGTVTVRR